MSDLMVPNWLLSQFKLNQYEEWQAIMNHSVRWNISQLFLLNHDFSKMVFYIRGMVKECDISALSVHRAKTHIIAKTTKDVNILNQIGCKVPPSLTPPVNTHFYPSTPSMVPSFCFYFALFFGPPSRVWMVSRASYGKRHTMPYF